MPSIGVGLKLGMNLSVDAGGLTEYAGVSGLVLLLDHLSDVTLDSGNLEQWNDRSFNKAHAIQSDTSKQPLSVASGPVNSLRSVSFDGVDEFLNLDAHVGKFSPLTEQSLFIVYDLPVSASRHIMLSMTDSTDTTGSNETEFVVQKWGVPVGWRVSDRGTNFVNNNVTALVGNDYMEFYTSLTPAGRGVPFPATTFQRAVAKASSTTAASFSSLTTPDRFRLGMGSYNAVNGGDTGFFLGDIVMVIMFDHGLTSAEAALVQAEINSITGL